MIDLKEKNKNKNGTLNIWLILFIDHFFTTLRAHWTSKGGNNTLVEISLQITVARGLDLHKFGSVIQTEKASNSLQNIHTNVENKRASYWSSFCWQFTQSMILFGVLFLLRRCWRGRFFGNITQHLFYANHHISSAINFERN